MARTAAHTHHNPAWGHQRYWAVYVTEEDHVASGTRWTLRYSGAVIAAAERAGTRPVPKRLKHVPNIRGLWPKSGMTAAREDQCRRSERAAVRVAARVAARAASSADYVGAYDIVADMLPTHDGRRAAWRDWYS